jgi:hypothetical protein
MAASLPGSGERWGASEVVGALDVGEIGETHGIELSAILGDDYCVFVGHERVQGEVTDRRPTLPF